jgi:phthalate 4,5-cis-dihydrodiol dehydrogenase
VSKESSGKAPLLRLGIIGLGGATKQMLPSFASHPHVRLTAAADPRAEARDRFATDYGARTYESAEALCDNTNVDAVYIATPHQFHREHAVLAAKAGKHVIVEKPMALSLEDCDAIIAAAEEAGVHMVVGHTHSFDLPIRKMREIIASGELGPVAMINTWNYTNFLYRPRRPEELRTDLGGGIIYNQVPHQVDMVRLLGGGLVRSVRSMAWALDPERPTEGSHVSFLQFEDGSAASMVFSGYDYFDSDEFHFWLGELGEQKPANLHGAARVALKRIGGSQVEAELKSAAVYGRSASPAAANTRPISTHHPHFGIIIVSCWFGDLRPAADGVTIYGRDGRLDVPVAPSRAFPDKTGVINEMYDAVFRGCMPLHDGRWGKATMEVSRAILDSARQRREIQLSHQVAVRDSPPL